MDDGGPGLAQETQAGTRWPTPPLPQPTPLLDISTCPGVSAADRAQIPPEEFLGALHA